MHACIIIDKCTHLHVYMYMYIHVCRYNMIYPYTYMYTCMYIMYSKTANIFDLTTDDYDIMHIKISFI